METDMYEMYPEWGPANHADEPAPYLEAWTAALQESLDLRDNGGERPDDN
ncbi:MAG: hypothetical protein H0V49_11895 [Nocardioidaceae bacterium]|nr:hypothetical protein [Nocardioidaceae bacterium]